MSKAFVLSTSYAKCGNSNHTIFKEEESVEMIKFPVLINLWYKWVDYVVFNIESIQKIKTQVFQTLLMANSCDLLIALCEMIKLGIIKEQEAKELLRILSKIPMLSIIY